MRTIYLNRDNKFDLALESDYKVTPASDYNRFVLYMKDTKTGVIVTIDSNTAGAGVFDTTQTRFFNNKLASVLRLMLGLGAFGLVANSVYECYLRVYSASITHGLVWPDHDDTFRVKVLDGP